MTKTTTISPAVCVGTPSAQHYLHQGCFTGVSVPKSWFFVKVPAGHFVCRCCGKAI
jgi:hypothetical protein